MVAILGWAIGRTGHKAFWGGGDVVRRPLESVTGASWRPGACNCLVALDTGQGLCCSDAGGQRASVRPAWSWAGQIERFKSRDF